MTVDFEKKYMIEAYDITINGEGIARFPASDVSGMPTAQSGKLVFCPNLLPGEVAEAGIDEEKKNYIYASIVQYINNSDDRKTVDCEVFGSCGGCVLQHISYEKQLEIKKKHVLSCLVRIGKFDESDMNVLVRPVLGMEVPYFYRNHVQYQVEEAGGFIRLGFYERQTNKLIIHEKCCLVPEICHQIQLQFPTFCAENHIRVQNRENHQNRVQKLSVRMGFHTGDLMLIVEGRGHLHFPAEKYADFMQQFIEEDEKLRKANWKIKSIWEKQMGEHAKYKLLWGAKYIEECIGDKIYMISPSSFFQVNSQQTLVLYNQIKKFADKSISNVYQSDKGKLIDLYCGTGTIGLHLSNIFPYILGVEINPEAVFDAEQNARRNGVVNCAYIRGKAEKEVFQIDSDDVVIIDPPRKGCDKRLLEILLSSMAQSIIYVSCDPATLARDLRKLADGGYKIEAVQPVDMFPWTGHVETIVSLRRQNI